jgi:alanine racemase
MTVGAWRNWLQQQKGTIRSMDASSDENTPLQISFDSRLLINPLAGPTLFVAIKGAWHDGHDYLTAAHKSGVRYFLVSNQVTLPPLPNADVIAVSDVLLAWQQLAGKWRREWSQPVIGITGSNGKTTVKEWLCQLLNHSFHVHSSPRSYNSQIGVPMSLWDLQSSHQLAVIEAAISQPGEMQRHADCIQPDFGVLTHLGSSHLEAFNGQEHLLEEKLKLFDSCAWIAMPGSLNSAAEKLRDQGKRVLTWGTAVSNDMQVSSEATPQGRSIAVRWANQSFVWMLPFGGESGFRNAMTAALVALEWGVDGRQIGESIQYLRDLDLRMQRLRTHDGAWILSDAYTNDWDALALALQDLDKLPGHLPKAAIIGSIPGMKPKDQKRLIALIKGSSVQLLWLVGDAWKALDWSEVDSVTCRHFSSTSEILQALEVSADAFRDHDILIKGPRADRFERFHPLLMQRGHVTQLELDLEAVAHNLKTTRAYVREHGGDHVSIIAVIKASGYGTNGPALARLLQFHGVEIMAVACTEEGVELRRHGLVMRILVLNPEPDTFRALVKHRLEPALHRLEHLDELTRIVQQSNQTQPWPVHLKLDTGMHRLGFTPEECPALHKIIANHPHLLVRTVFSHLAAADDPQLDADTSRQIHLFNDAVEVLRHPSQPFKTHILNSAGLIRFPGKAGDYVRTGIGLFGVRVTEIPETWDLQPAVRFTTAISAIHTIPAGEGVGYGFTDASDHPRQVATLPVGYADGFPRHLSHGVGSVAIHGAKAPVVGWVCMDMVMVDVTAIPSAQPGDEVELFGQTISLESFAQAAGTIPYEILTRITARVQRQQRGN